MADAQGACIVINGFHDNLQKLNGKYQAGEESGGRISYHKHNVRGSSCCVYYWNEDDDMRGWWIAPSINSDEVWARNPSTSDSPPKTGWYFPWESKTPNRRISISYIGAPARKAIDMSVKKRQLPASGNLQVSTVKKINIGRSKEDLEQILAKVVESLSTIETDTAACEDLVDQLKDTGVMFTCEVVDHMCPNEVMEMKKKADDVGKEAQERIQKLKREIQALRIETDQCQSLGGAKYSNAKTQLEGLSKKVAEFYTEVSQIVADAARGAQKAEQKRRQDEQEKILAAKKSKQEEAQKAQRLAVQKVSAFQIILKPIKTNFETMKSLKEIRDAESIVTSMLEDIAKDTPLCTGNSQQVLRSTAATLKPFLKKLEDKRRDILMSEMAQVQELATKLAQTIQGYMEKEKLDEDAMFALIAKSKTGISEADLETFVESLELGESYTKDLFVSVFGRALLASSSEDDVGKNTLTKDEFFLHVVHTLYSTRSAVMELEHKKNLPIGDGDIVEVIEGPVGEPLKVRCKLMSDGTIGWMPFKFLQRMSPKFTVVQETVLTDRHELKGFSVKQRLRPGTKLLATQVPKVDATTKLLRLAVMVVDGDVPGFVTAKGNRGAQLLKQDAMDTAFGAGPVTAKKLSNEDWTRMVSNLTGSVTTELKAMIGDIVSMREDCDEKCVTLEALADGWTADVLEETSKAAVQSWEKIDNLIQHLTAKLSVQSRDFGSVSLDVPGPLSEVKTTLEDVSKRLQEAKTVHVESTKRARLLSKKLLNELAVQSKKKEAAKKEEFLNGRVNECIARTEVVIGMINRVSEDADSEEAILTLQASFNEAEEMVSTTRSWLEETKKECSTMGTNAELNKSVGDLANRVNKLNATLTSRKAKVARAWGDMVDMGALTVAKILREHMEMNQLSQHGLFAELTKETDGVLTLPALQSVLATMKAELSASIVEKIFNKISAKGSDKITASQFDFLCNNYYRVIKATSVTDSMEIKGGNRVCGLKPHDCVKVIGPLEIDAATKVARARIEFDDKEGFATIVGHQGMVFLESQSFYYQVTKETVLTDKFEMSGFKVVRRLRTGDILRAQGLPKMEEKSKQWRVEVVVLLSKANAGKPAECHMGFVTIKGAQGASFVQSVSIEGMDVEEPDIADVVEKEISEKGPQSAHGVCVVSDVPMGA